MLRRIVTESLKTCSRQQRLFTAEAAPKEKWDLHAGVLVERLPVLTKPFNEIEAKFQELLSQVEFENSLKSDFEVQHEKELRQAEKIKKGEIEIDLDDSASKQTAQDRLDAWNEELKHFQLAPRLTKADKQNDLQSTNRALEKNLYLLVEQKLGDQTHMILPQGIRQEGESLRQTAERVLKERCGEDMRVLFYGNAPCGFFKYKFPAAMRKDSVGVKIFFFRSALNAGKVDKKVTNKFEWVDKNGLSSRLQDRYRHSIEQFLVE